jgi:hypothetical protein
MSNRNRWKIMHGSKTIGVYDRLWTAKEHGRRYSAENKTAVKLVDTSTTNKSTWIGWKYLL